ncbi:LysR substrate-binding domain-containing protein [Cupriavidus basilensis]|uniref:LysR substrate-binding domain-containing protein n=1 Tax=Cupriavidus basilensis TaxID=68895 RepID=A0ABT6B2G9_9BURK|nr:LysR substrate-binding domain-containing protein [Cupriavidus basilensis]MDF3838983.1 LysR substrate-binding domain-containing protein [Cupriavidus basilensis]
MNRIRLPLLGLRAFEATARHQSVSNAAAELCVTPGAVSQQVKLLEELVGVPLLRRKGRSIELTDAGQVLRPALTQAFQTIELTLNAIARGPRHDTLKLCLMPTLAEKWLVPRLSRFHGAHPELDIQLMTSFREIRFEAEDVDMASFVGKTLPAGLEGLRLFDDAFQPVCNPSFLRGPQRLSTPADLSKVTLLHSVRRMDDWQRWLGLAGLSGLKPQRSLSFENSSLAIQAAIDGLGVAMVQREYVGELLKVGVLVAPFDFVGRSDTGYYLVWSAARATTPAFRSFLEWVKQEAGRGTA